MLLVFIEIILLSLMTYCIDSNNKVLWNICFDSYFLHFHQILIISLENTLSIPLSVLLWSKSNQYSNLNFQLRKSYQYCQRQCQSHSMFSYII